MISKLEAFLKIAESSEKPSEMFCALVDEMIKFFQLTEEEQDRFHQHLWNVFLKKGKLSKKLPTMRILKQKLKVKVKKSKFKKTSRSNPAKQALGKLLGE